MKKYLIIGTISVIIVLLSLTFITTSTSAAEVAEQYSATLSFSSSNSAVYSKFATDAYVAARDTSGCIEGISDAALYKLASENGVSLPTNLSTHRKNVLKAAFAGAKVNIPYWYGGGHYGTAVHPGLAKNDFGSSTAADYKGRSKKGLDCSGFVGWAYYTAGLNSSELGMVMDGGTYAMYDTASMRARPTMSQVSNADKMLPGDIGFLDNGTATGASDHTGIYLGKAGNTLIWIDDSGSKGTTVRNTNFNYYYRVEGMEG